MRKLFPVYIILSLTLQSYSQTTCECPDNMPVKTFLLDYYSTQQSDQFLACFKNDESYKNSGVFINSLMGFAFIDCKNNIIHEFESSFYSIELHVMNGNAVIKKVLPLPHLYINSNRGWMFQSKIIEQLEINERGHIVKMNYELDIQKNLNQQDIQDVKASFYKELEKVSNEPEFKFQYWKHGVNLAVCALNGDIEARNYLKNYPDAFSQAKGQVIYLLGGYNDVFDGKLLNNLNDFIDWYYNENDEE